MKGGGEVGIGYPPVHPLSKENLIVECNRKGRTIYIYVLSHAHDIHQRENRPHGCVFHRLLKCLYLHTLKPGVKTNQAVSTYWACGQLEAK